MNYLLAISFIFLSIALENSNAATVFLHGTEHCGIARDSRDLLEKKGTEPHVSFVRSDCVERPPGSLPHMASPDPSLLIEARNCSEVIGQDRWEAFEQKWNEVYQKDRPAQFLSASDSHIVGAYCKSIKEAKAKNSNTLTILNFGHGTVVRSRQTLDQPASLSQKKGSFEFGSVTYPADVVWALNFLIPEKMRVVNLFENCFGELIMNNADLGPDQGYDGYRENSCSIAAAPHDQLLVLSVSGDTEYRVIDNQCYSIPPSNVSEATNFSNTFMRNFKHYSKDNKDPLTIENFYQWVTKSKRLTWSKVDPEKEMTRFGVPVDHGFYMPVPGSMSLLTLYYEKHGLSRTIKQKDICEVCQRRSQVELNLDKKNKIVLNQITDGLDKKIKTIHAELFPNEKDINLLQINKWIFEQEDDDPNGPLSQAYVDLNNAKAENDKRSGDHEKLCGHLRTPPHCEKLSRRCTLSDVASKCQSDNLTSKYPTQLQSGYYKNACRKIKEDEELNLNKELDKFSDRIVNDMDCPNEDLRCYTEDKLSDYKKRKYKDFKKIEAKVMKARMLVRMTQSYFGLDTMLSNLNHSQQSIRDEARQAFDVYNNMIQCEIQEIFQ